MIHKYHRSAPFMSIFAARSRAWTTYAQPTEERNPNGSKYQLSLPLSLGPPKPKRSRRQTLCGSLEDFEGRTLGYKAKTGSSAKAYRDIMTNSFYWAASLVSDEIPAQDRFIFFIPNPLPVLLISKANTRSGYLRPYFGP